MVTLLPDPNSVSIADTHDCRNNCHHHGTMGHESPTNLPNCTVRMSSYRIALISRSLAPASSSSASFPANVVMRH